MNSALIRNVILAANLPYVSCVISAWGSGAQGTYANDAGRERGGTRVRR
jgi:hypothetical protein